MTNPITAAITGATRIFDGHNCHEESALLLEEGRVADIVPHSGVPAQASVTRLNGGVIAPGFVDLQVNGGGGVMLNDGPSVQTIERICRAHARFGTTALLPTLITDTPALTTQAIQAAQEAARRQVPGFLGLHLEGPHLSVSRKGAHDPLLIRPMEEADCLNLIAARKKLPVLLSTVAPESVSPAQIGRLTAAGVIVSLGHSDAGVSQARAGYDAGAVMATHLFNAMSQLTNREPGMVGALLEAASASAGLIADGIHVAPEAIRVALRAKAGPGRIFLVTDAMATIGTGMTAFTLNGRTILRANGRLTLADGTLAGADLDMAAAVRFMVETVGLEAGEALRMASLYPAQAVGRAPEHGTLRPGARGDFVHLTDRLLPLQTWIGGRHAAGSEDAS